MKCQTVKDIVYHLYVKSKKYNKLVNITKKKSTHKYRELVVTNGRVLEVEEQDGGKREFLLWLSSNESD